MEGDDCDEWFTTTRALRGFSLHFVFLYGRYGDDSDEWFTTRRAGEDFLIFFSCCMEDDVVDEWCITRRVAVDFFNIFLYAWNMMLVVVMSDLLRED